VRRLIAAQEKRWYNKNRRVMMKMILIIFVVMLFGCSKNEQTKNHTSDAVINTQLEMDTSNIEVSQTQKTDEANYNNGNGTVMDYIITENEKIVIRKNDQKLEIGKNAQEQNLSIYSNYTFDSTKLATLSIGEYIDIFQIIKKEIVNETEIWLKIRTKDELEGYIYLRKYDPYNNNMWSILEIVTENNKIWTVRKLEQHVWVDEILDVHEKPGIDSKILFQLNPNNEYLELNLETVAITEEEDTVNGITDYWIKIIESENNVGWIFGGNVTVDRNRIAKYFSPENQIESVIGGKY
jgi:predicted nucleic-acid-binding protein